MPLTSGKAIRLSLLMVLASGLSGCAAVFAFEAGQAAGTVKMRHDRATFIEDFQKQNVERQKVGLPPLDWCEEIYRTTPRWYAWDGSCANGPEATKLRKMPPNPPHQEKGPAMTPGTFQSPSTL
jgi:hypothetical protein